MEKPVFIRKPDGEIGRSWRAVGIHKSRLHIDTGDLWPRMVFWGGLRVDQVTTERFTDRRSLTNWRERGERRYEGRRCSKFSLCQPRVGRVYGPVSTTVTPLSGDPGHRGDEKIIAPSVRAPRDKRSDGHQRELKPACGTHPIQRLNTAPPAHRGPYQ